MEPAYKKFKQKLKYKTVKECKLGNTEGGVLLREGGEDKNRYCNCVGLSR